MSELSLDNKSLARSSLTIYDTTIDNNIASNSIVGNIKCAVFTCEKCQLDNPKTNIAMASLFSLSHSTNVLFNASYIINCEAQNAIDLYATTLLQIQATLLQTNGSFDNNSADYIDAYVNTACVVDMNNYDMSDIVLIAANAAIDPYDCTNDKAKGLLNIYNTETCTSTDCTQADSLLDGINSGDLAVTAFTLYNKHITIYIFDCKQSCIFQNGGVSTHLAKVSSVNEMSINSINVNNNNTMGIFTVSGNTYIENIIISNSQITYTNINASTELILLFDAIINLNNNKGEFLLKLFVSNDITVGTVNINSNDIQYTIMIVANDCIFTMQCTNLTNGNYNTNNLIALLVNITNIGSVTMSQVKKKSNQEKSTYMSNIITKFY